MIGYLPPAKKVLVLHGYSQNADMFSKRLGALRKESKSLEFIFINAPHVLLPADLMFDTNLPPSEFTVLEQTQANPELALRGWWRGSKGSREKTEAAGLHEAIMTVKEALVKHRFEGIFGFSQGGAFAAFISAMLEKPELYEEFLVDGKPPHPPFKFCVSVSGFRLNDPFCDKFFPYKTPTLHVLGRTDVIVVEERSQQLLDISLNRRIEEHEGGHFVPTKGQWRKFMVSWMNNPAGNHASPTPLLAADSELGGPKSLADEVAENAAASASTAKA